MTITTDLYLPAQRARTKTRAVKPGDWALATHWVPHIIDVERAGYILKEPALMERVFRGLVVATPYSGPTETISYNRYGEQPVEIPKFRLFHLTDVKLIELEGEARYDKHADLLLDPTSQLCEVVPFDVPRSAPFEPMTLPDAHFVRL